MAEEETKTKKTEVAEIVQIATQHADVVKIPGQEQPTDMLGLLVELYNKVDKIEKAVA